MESQVTLSGYVGSEVEFSRGADWCAARFRLGCTPHWRKGTTWVNGETTWLTVRMAGATAENVRDSVRKGDPLIVSGRLRTRVWEDKDQVHHEMLVIEAQSLGHDLAKGVSTFIRPMRSEPVVENEPLGPSEEDLPYTPAPPVEGEPPETGATLTDDQPEADDQEQAPASLAIVVDEPDF